MGVVEDFCSFFLGKGAGVLHGGGAEINHGSTQSCGVDAAVFDL